MFILLPIAFVSGILTILTPCVLPVLPVILASGVEGKIWRIRGIIAGIVISFTLAALTLSAIVRILGVPADTVRNIAVVFLLIFGLSLVFPVVWNKILGFVDRFWKFEPVKTKNEGFTGGILTGASLGLVWTPCIGPIVASVATLAAVDSFSGSSILLVSTYSLGIGLGLYLIAKAGTRVSEKFAFFKEKSQIVNRILGVVIIGTAIFIAVGADRGLRTWTLSVLPEAWTQLPTRFENIFNVNQFINPSSTQEGSAEPGSTVVRDVSLQSDFTGARVNSSDLIQGCFGGKDCIPSIDDPKFESVQSANTWLSDSDLVFAIDYNGLEKAYPQRILNWHEIVNDSIRLRSGQDEAIAITFCPLCGSALGFERKVNQVITKFGVSGKLHNNDLVMYDRYEGNLWQQITGEGIVGPAARRNERLKQIPVVTTTWREWKKEHPNTLVLSRDTGHIRDYDLYPYGTYEQDDELLFGVKNLDRSLPIKTPVYGIEVDGKSKAYPASVFEKSSTINDSLGGFPLRLEKTKEGKIKVTNLNTNEEIIPIRLFWFSWAAFHPDTELFKQ